MKNMRKLTALLLAVVMVLSLSIAVFARDGGSISSATINGETATISTIDVTHKLTSSDLEWHNPVHSIRVFSEERSHYVYGKCNSYI